MEALVSIIVPVYKVELYLDECIKCLVNQTYQNLEIILIDDESPDRCPEICDLWASKDSRIKVIHNRNQGVSHARNTGLKLAKGEYITFCDADDQYKQDYIKKMGDAALNNDADIVICSYSVLQGTSERIICDRQSGEVDINEIYRGIFIDNTIGGFVWNKLFKRSLLSDIKFNECMQICEDTHFVCRSLKKANKIYYLGDSLYLYRLHSASTMSNVQNMFDENGNLKYAVVFQNMLVEGIVEEQYAQYVKADMCVLAIGVKCDYLNSDKKKDKDIIRRLDKHIIHNMGALLACNEYTLKKKIICVGNALFNLRRYKNFISSRRT